jgi:hypothetical protein
MEKRRPHYSLESIKAAFTTVESLRMTRTAQNFANAQGLGRQGVVDLIQQITRESFHHSMTSRQSSAIWQDVYHVRWAAMVLYLKFTTDHEGYLVISLKEK